jgi:C-terminal processing protease CtpA/Prc
MQKSQLIIYLIVLGACFLFVTPQAIIAEQPTTANEKTQTDNQTPQLKPDLPKLDQPRLEHPSHPRKQLKGSVQHSEVLKSKEDHLDGGAAKLETKVTKQKFKLKTRQLNAGLNEGVESGLGIIGLKFAVYFGRAPVVYQVFPDTPADGAGVRPRDTILAVDGVPTIGLSKNEVYNMIVGKPGTEVTLSFLHNHNFESHALKRMDVNDIADPKVRRDYLGM